MSNIKNYISRINAFLLSIIMILSIVMSVLADNDSEEIEDSSNKSERGITSTDDEWSVTQDAAINSLTTSIQADIGIAYTVVIPKTIVMELDKKKVDYEVYVYGEVSGDQYVTINPVENVTLAQSGKDSVTAVVKQEQTIFKAYDYTGRLNSTTEIKMAETADNIEDTNISVGTIYANGEEGSGEITAGNWSGRVSFTIKLNDPSEDNYVYTDIPKIAALEDTEELPYNTTIDTLSDDYSIEIYKLNNESNEYDICATLKGSELSSFKEYYNSETSDNYIKLVITDTVYNKENTYYFRLIQAEQTTSIEPEELA